MNQHITCTEPLVWTCKGCGHSFHTNEWQTHGRQCPACTEKRGEWKCSLCQADFKQSYLGTTHPCFSKGAAPTPYGPSPQPFPVRNRSRNVTKIVLCALGVVLILVLLGITLKENGPTRIQQKTPITESASGATSKQLETRPLIPIADRSTLYNDEAFTRQLKQVCGWNERGFIERVDEAPVDFFNAGTSGSGNDEVPGNFWKEVARRYGEVYLKAQRHSNDQRKLITEILRKEIEDLFARRLGLRGGGSTSATMWIFIPGLVEWIIGHEDMETDRPISDSDLLEFSMNSYPFNMNPDPIMKVKLDEIISDLKKIEAQLPPHQAAFLRSEFVRFFAKD